MGLELLCGQEHVPFLLEVRVRASSGGIEEASDLPDMHHSPLLSH